MNRNTFALNKWFKFFNIFCFSSCDTASFSILNCVILKSGNLPPKGVLSLLEKLITLVIAPLFVGLVIELISRWLDEKDDN
ncbi:type I toxin-antitoxin system Fst family toxin [Enterococcus hirae]